jgi:hypothetical protein
MKIDIGESLLASWLKYEKKCQFTQLNWKFNTNVNEVQITENLNSFFNDLKKKYSISSGLKQLIKQSEIDVIGIRVTPTENGLFLNEFFAIEVAFHESGLNYGNNEERIAKKMIRAALSLYFSTGSKKGNIIFATPSMRKPDETKNICEELNNQFANKGFDFRFSLILNEDFYGQIIEPITQKVKEIKDTSDLFIRALKLNLISESKSLDEVDETNVIDDPDENLVVETLDEINFNTSNLNELLSKTNLGIGKRALRFFKVLESEGKLTNEIIHNRGLGKFSLFKAEEAVKTENLNNRYYQSYSFNIDNEHYLLCNNWYEKDEVVLYEIFKEVK